MLLNMHFKKYCSNFENYTYVIVKREWDRAQNVTVNLKKKWNICLQIGFLCLLFYALCFMAEWYWVLGKSQLPLRNPPLGSWVVHVT